MAIKQYIVRGPHVVMEFAIEYAMKQAMREGYAITRKPAAFWQHNMFSNEPDLIVFVPVTGGHRNVQEIPSTCHCADIADHLSRH